MYGILASVKIDVTMRVKTYLTNRLNKYVINGHFYCFCISFSVCNNVTLLF